jgi:hypothetical protein
LLRTSHDLTHQIYRETLHTVLKTHNLFVTNFIDSKKRPHAELEDPSPIPETTAVAMPHDHCKQVDSDTSEKDACLQSDYPNINFWMKEEWIEYESKRKDSANPINKPGVRGRMRCAQGENVSMKYIETEDRTLISGRQVAAIREYARDLWKDFYQRGLAPQKWSDALKGVKDKYAQDMEETFKVLRYCNNH